MSERGANSKIVRARDLLGSVSSSISFSFDISEAVSVMRPIADLTCGSVQLWGVEQATSSNGPFDVRYRNASLTTADQRTSYWSGYRIYLRQPGQDTNTWGLGASFEWS